MHLHQKSNQFSNGLRVLFVLLITYATCCNASLSIEEIEETMRSINNDLPTKYCGQRLTSAMKILCIPSIRDMIRYRSPAKKSLTNNNGDVDFSVYDVDRMDNYDDDDAAKGRYKTELEDLFLSNDIPFMSQAQAQANRRRRRGIIDDCCKRACLKSQLVRYCPNRG